MISNLRLASGFVLFVYVLGHFGNHALGLVSLDWMNKASYYTIDPWRTLPGTVLILSALVTHIVLAVWAIFARRGFRMRNWEFFQILSGFAIPLLLSAHVLSARGGYEVFGLNEGYAFQLYVQWVALPYRSILTLLALVLVWIHACIGWHYWLRYERWYNTYLPLFFGFAVVYPTLAIAGILSAGFQVLRLSEDENWVNSLLRKVRSKGDAYTDLIDFYEQLIISGILLILLSAVAYQLAMIVWKYRQYTLRLDYRGVGIETAHELKVPRGMTVLRNLQKNRIPHASVCGGHGRCSTCRIRVEDYAVELPPPTLEERKILKRIGAEENVRLACQLKIQGDMAVTALLRPDIGSREALNQYRHKTGEEQEVAILFADIRAFTKLSEAQLPYDTAFMLNRFFSVMGKAIEDSGGHLDKFIGDGVMAIFGIDKSLDTGCREALIAARTMSSRLKILNQSLTNDIGQPLKIGIGIHCGTAIIGNMGYNKAVGLTAIGDVVNTASRLENLTKTFSAELIVSKKAAQNSGLELPGATSHKADIRGRDEALDVLAMESASLIHSDSLETL